MRRFLSSSRLQQRHRSLEREFGVGPQNVNSWLTSLFLSYNKKDHPVAFHKGDLFAGKKMGAEKGPKPDLEDVQEVSHTLTANSASVVDF